MMCMRQFLSLIILATLSILSLIGRDQAPAVGDPAPDFELVGSDGQTYSLSQFKGEKAVVLAWFPKAFTGG